MAAQVHGWTVKVDQRVERAILPAMERLARNYGLLIRYSVDAPDTVSNVEISSVSNEPMPPLAAATFTIALTALMDGTSVTDIVRRVADDAQSVMPPFVAIENP